MALTNTVVETEYQGDGSTTNFNITFAYQESAQVKVRMVNQTTGVEETLVQGTDFTVTSTQVVMTTAPATDEAITVYRDTELTQETEYDNTGPFPADTHEDTLDRIVMMIQEIANDLANVEATGGGEGDGAFIRLDDQAVAAAGTVSISTNQRMIKNVASSSGLLTADTTTPIEAGTIDGQELLLCGTSDANALTIPSGGNAKINGDCLLGLYNTLMLVWDNSNSYWLEIARR